MMWTAGRRATRTKTRGRESLQPADGQQDEEMKGKELSTESGSLSSALRLLLWWCGDFSASSVSP